MAEPTPDTLERMRIWGQRAPDVGWWKQAGDWMSQHPGQSLDINEVYAAGAPPEKYAYLMDQPGMADAVQAWHARQDEMTALGGGTGGDFPTKPGMENLARSGYADMLARQEANEFNFANRAEALDQLRAALGDLPEESRARLDKWLSGGLTDIGAAKTATLATAKERGEAAQAHLEAAYTDVQSQLTGLLSTVRGAREYTDEMVTEVAGMGDKALREFQTNIGNQMQTWTSGQQANLRNMKDEEATRLREAGYSADEINDRMAQMDLQMAQTAGVQMGAFQQQDVESRRTMRQTYDTLEAGARQAGAAIYQALAGIEAGGRAQAMGVFGALSQAQADAEKWRGDVERVAHMGSAELAGNLRSNRMNMESAIAVAQMSGMGNWATMWQTNAYEVEPIFNTYAGLFGLQHQLLQNSFTMDASGFNEILNAMLQGQGTVQSILGTLVMPVS